LAFGVGCRAGCPAGTIEALVRKVMEQAGPAPMMALFTAVEKQGEPGIAAAAAALGLPLVFLPRAVMEAAAPAAQTRSERVVELFGVPSVAETAALAGAGQGATLVVKRVAEGGATCAAARGAEAGE
jgi:cobalt-precorrin 5A hydrolase